MYSSAIEQYFSRSERKIKNYVRASRPFLGKKKQLIRARRPIIHLYSLIFITRIIHKKMKNHKGMKEMKVFLFFDSFHIFVVIKILI